MQNLLTLSGGVGSPKKKKERKKRKKTLCEEHKILMTSRSEAIKWALPVGANSPQKAPYGLYTEKLSGTAFTAPRHENQQAWLYRILPSAAHSRFERTGDQTYNRKLEQIPNQLRWNPFDIDENVDWVRGLQKLSGAGDPSMKTGLGIYMYAAGCSMAPRTAMYSSDGEMLIVAQHGVMDVTTEFGGILVRPMEILVIPRGVKYRVDLVAGSPIRGYILELYEGHFVLPELGPIGSNCLANPRDFQIPVARFDQDAEPWTVINKFSECLFTAKQDHTPFDVVGWHGK